MAEEMNPVIEKSAEKISNAITGEVLPGEPLSKHTTYQVGGRADILVCPAGSEEAEWVYLYGHREGIPVTVIGWGSNVIAPDGGIEGIVLKMKNGQADIRDLGDGRIYAQAGVSLIDVARHAAAKGLGGLEPVAGIPGTVGGALLMNAGTRDGEMSSVVSCAEVVTPTGARYTIARDDMNLGYRRSVFQQSDWLILGATLQLVPDDPDRLKTSIDSILRERMRKFPLDEANAGSVFKRPSGDYAGRLIEAAGCKGLRIGGAAVSERHANFIVNVEDATADDIMKLIAEVRKRVFGISGVYLELEQIPLSSAAVWSRK